jgi:HlyD family secretion protein
VIADFNSPFEQRQTLGDEYRIEARIVIDELYEVVQVPSGVLLREGDRWTVFRVINRRATLQHVETGKTNELQAEIVAGVSPDDVLILHPTDKIQDGTAVRWK